MRNAVITSAEFNSLHHILLIHIYITLLPAHDEFQYYGLKQILTSDNNKVMNPTTFEDMWYIMTEVKQLVEHSKDVSALLPFFRHVDTNGKVYCNILVMAS